MRFLNKINKLSNSYFVNRNQGDMMKNTILKIAFILYFCFFWNDIIAVVNFKVGVIHNPPFSIKIDDAHWKGLGIDLWKRVAEENDIHYRLEEVKNLQNMKELETYDVIVGAFPYDSTISSGLNMSLPYYTAGYGILIKVDHSVSAILKDIFDNIFSWSFLYFLLSVLLIMTLIGGVVWVIERKNNNNDFPQDVREGLFYGLCWATSFTGGWGLTSPKTHLGKIITVFWVLSTFLAASNATALITTLLTKKHMVDQIRKPDDLRYLRIAAVVDLNNRVRSFLDQHHFNYYSVQSIVDGVNLLENKNVDVVLADAPLLGYYMKNNPDSFLMLHPLNLGKDYYGFLINENNKHFLKKINKSILNTIHTQLWQDICFYYINTTYV